MSNLAREIGDGPQSRTSHLMGTDDGPNPPPEPTLPERSSGEIGNELPVAAEADSVARELAAADVVAHAQGPSTMTTSNVLNKVPVQTPSPNDVLCGRGMGSRFTHPGNQRFRAFCAARLEEYTTAPRRAMKTRIVKEIVRQVHDNGGRFLVFGSNQHRGGDSSEETENEDADKPKKNRKTSKKKSSVANACCWYQATYEVAREKVGHTLRDAASDKNKSVAILHRRQKLQREFAAAAAANARAATVPGRSDHSLLVGSAWNHSGASVPTQRALSFYAGQQASEEPRPKGDGALEKPDTYHSSFSPPRHSHKQSAPPQLKEGESRTGEKVGSDGTSVVRNEDPRLDHSARRRMFEAHFAPGSAGPTPSSFVAEATGSDPNVLREQEAELLAIEEKIKNKNATANAAANMLFNLKQMQRQQQQFEQAKHDLEEQTKMKQQQLQQEKEALIFALRREQENLAKQVKTAQQQQLLWKYHQDVLTHQLSLLAAAERDSVAGSSGSATRRSSSPPLPPQPPFTASNPASTTKSLAPGVAVLPPVSAAAVQQIPQGQRSLMLADQRILLNQVMVGGKTARLLQLHELEEEETKRQETKRQELLESLVLKQKRQRDVESDVLAATVSSKKARAGGHQELHEDEHRVDNRAASSSPTPFVSGVQRLSHHRIAMQSRNPSAGGGTEGDMSPTTRERKPDLFSAPADNHQETSQVMIPRVSVHYNHNARQEERLGRFKTGENDLRTTPRAVVGLVEPLGKHRHDQRMAPERTVHAMSGSVRDKFADDSFEGQFDDA